MNIFIGWKLNTKNTIEKMKLATNTKTFKELAKYLDISLSAINNWKKRDSIPEAILLKIIQNTNVSIEWLTSEDEPILTFNEKEKLEFFDIYKKIEKLIYIDEDKDLIEEKKRLVRDGLDGILIGLKGYI